MAMKRTVLISLAVTAMLIQLGIATDHTVGGSSGWDTSSNIQSWASKQTFAVGDNLIFKYSPMHDLVEVPKSDYDNCQATNLIQAYSDGNTSIALTSPGKRYFICTTPGHCLQGMKLAVDVLATSPSPASPPRRSVTPSLFSPEPAGSPVEATAPTASTPLSPSSPSPMSPSDDSPSVTPIAPSTETTTGNAPAPSAAPARGGFRAGLMLVFAAIVMVLAF